MPLRDPHHDGSALYVPEQEPSPGDTVPLFVRVPHGDGAPLAAGADGLVSLPGDGPAFGVWRIA